MPKRYLFFDWTSRGRTLPRQGSMLRAVRANESPLYFNISRCRGIERSTSNEGMV